MGDWVLLSKQASK